MDAVHMRIMPALIALFVGAVVVVGAAVLAWKWLLLAAAVYVGVRVARRVWRRYRFVVRQREAHLAWLAARADDQNEQVLAGDARGVYGKYPPAGFVRG